MASSTGVLKNEPIITMGKTQTGTWTVVPWPHVLIAMITKTNAARLSPVVTQVPQASQAVWVRVRTRAPGTPCSSSAWTAPFWAKLSKMTSTLRCFPLGVTKLISKLPSPSALVTLVTL